MGRHRNMHWHQFLALFTTGAVFLTVAPWPAHAKRRVRLLRVAALAFVFTFFVDSPAEHRAIWSFEGELHSELLDVPIENMLLTAASVPYTITIFLTIQSLVRRRISK
jgi:hypothetical protein